MENDIEFGYDADGMPLDLVDIMSDPWGAISGWSDYVSDSYGDDS